MECEFIPLINDKGGDITLVSNYMAIAISNVETKLLESVMLNKVRVNNDFYKYQYGFKQGHSTGLCTHVVKRTIEYYVDRGSHGFATFIDFTKAFDCVNYWILFNQLLDDGVDFNFVRYLVYWHTNQQARVRWHNTVSSKFPINNRTKQGGVLSPYLFTRHVRILLTSVAECGIGCCVEELSYRLRWWTFPDDLYTVRA